MAPLLARVDRLAADERYEDAAVLRDRRRRPACGPSARRQRLESLAAVPELVLARPDGAGGWHLSVVRRGRLVARGGRAAGALRCRATLAGLLLTAETPHRPGRRAGRLGRRDRTVLRWMEKPGTRLVELTGTLASPAPGTGAFTAFLARVDGTAAPAATRSPTGGRWAPGRGRSE